MKRIGVFLVILISLVGTVVPDAVAQTVLSGHFVTIWPDAQGGEQPPLHYLITKDGKWIELEVGDEVKGLRSLDRKQVTVEGSYEEPLAATVDSSAPQARTAESKSKFRVRSILPDEKESFAPMATEMAAQAAISGSKPWATILCRFSDSTGTTPRERPWFDELMAGSGSPSMDHFWRENSYGQMDFGGSRVFGWYNLPHPKAHYVFDTNGDGVEDADLQRLAEDCAAVADAEVYFPQYAGIDFVFNQDVGCCAWGGGLWLTLDNPSGQGYGATWLPPWALSQTTVAHERGHGEFRLPHSSGPYNTAYDSRWDPMSGAFYNCGTTPYGCIAPHTIAHHKADLLGWIPLERQYIAAPGSSQTIEIERLAQPAGAGYLMAKILINGSATEFYTVETRQRVGYDSPLPGDVVLIHHVDTTRWDRLAQVVDPDGNGDPNDAAAMWTPGETFVGVGGISVSVVSATANGFLVTISNGGAPPPPPPVQFTLSAAKNGNGVVAAPGIDCGSDCSEQFQDGAAVMRIPMKVIIESGHGDHGAERSDAGVGIISLTDHFEQEATSFFAAIPPAVRVDGRCGPGDPGWHQRSWGRQYADANRRREAEPPPWWSCGRSDRQ